MTKTTTILGLGFTGTFGHAFTKYSLKNNPDTHIRIFSRDEYKQGIMAEEFNSAVTVEKGRYQGEIDSFLVEQTPAGDRLSFMLGDIRDRERVDEAMQGVDVVIHAAALKQVPILENNPFEAKKTNIDGTMNVINSALHAGVRRSIFISTDKAVHPINVYGMTKAVAEKLWLSAGEATKNQKAGSFIAVRYGNVLCSRGSVVDLWKKQNEQTREITITDPTMTRFLLMPNQAAQFVWRVLEEDADYNSGSLFVPSLPTATVGDLAKAIVPKARQKIIGMRQGEKAHEELLTRYEYGKARRVQLLPNDFGIESYWIVPRSNSNAHETVNPYASNLDPNPLDVVGIRKLLEMELE